jgi:hypothetical protein
VIRGLRRRFLIAALVAGQALLAASSRSHADPLPAHAPRTADYDITVRLDVAAKRLTARCASPGEIRRPTASRSLVPLYLNAFCDRESTPWREPWQLRDVRCPRTAGAHRSHDAAIAAPISCRPRRSRRSTAIAGTALARTGCRSPPGGA